MLRKFSVSLHNRHTGLFTVYLLSYLLILVIPVVIGSISYMKSSSTLKKQTENYTVALLEKTGQEIDAVLGSVDQLMTSMTLDSRVQEILYIRSAEGFDEAYKILKTIQQISQYKSSSGYIEDLYVYYKNTDMILSYSSKFAPPLFFNEIISYENTVFDDWKMGLCRVNNREYLEQKAFSNGYVKKRVLSCRQSLPLGEAGEPLGTIVVSINIEKIEQLLKKVELLNHGLTYIIDHEDRVIASAGDLRFLHPYLQNKMTPRQDYFYEKIGGEEMLVTYTPSSVNRWRYVSVVPTRKFMQEVNDIRVVTAWIIAVELIIGFCISFLLARRNYIPIKRAADYLKDRVSECSANEGNELAFIVAAADAAVSKYEDIQGAMRKQQPVVRANALSQLVKGNLDTAQDIKSVLQSVGVLTEGEFFCVLTIQIDDCSHFPANSDLEQKMMVKFIIANVMEELGNEEYNAYAVDMDLNEVVVIINAAVNGQDLSGKMSGIAVRAKDFLLEKFHVVVSAGIGRIYKGMMGISLSYRESTRAAEYKMIKGYGSIVSFDEIPPSASEYTYSTSTEAQLINCIKIGDALKTQALLDEIICQNFSGDMISMEMARCLFFDIMGTALKVLNSINTDYRVIFGEDFQPVTRILSCSTVDEMHEILRMVFDRICEFIGQSKKSHNSGLKDKVLAYVNSHFQENTLCLTSIADALQMNPSYLSHFFKEQTGENFVDYLNKTRIEKVKELLTSTSLSLLEIAQKVGYEDGGRLNRTFKKYQGITPGQYRSYASQAKF